MASYVNAGIEEILNQFTPEEKLSHLIMEEVQSDKDQELTARDIEKLLKAPGVSSVEREAVALLRGPGSCQKYLGTTVQDASEIDQAPWARHRGLRSLSDLRAKSCEKGQE
jgi:histone H3/H4